MDIFDRPNLELPQSLPGFRIAATTEGPIFAGWYSGNWQHPVTPHLVGV